MPATWKSQKQWGWGNGQSWAKGVEMVESSRSQIMKSSKFQAQKLTFVLQTMRSHWKPLSGRTAGWNLLFSVLPWPLGPCGFGHIPKLLHDQLQTLWETQIRQGHIRRGKKSLSPAFHSMVHWNPLYPFLLWVWTLRALTENDVWSQEI